jgi:putative transposase
MDSQSESSVVRLVQQRPVIQERTKAYLVEQADEGAMLAQEGARNGKAKRRSPGGGVVEGVKLYCASTLRKLVDMFRKHGISGLAEGLVRSGNRTSYFRPEEEKLLMATIQSSYLTPERKSQATTVEDVKRVFLKENQLREAANFSPLRIPGRDAVRTRIKNLDRLVVMIERYGRDEAMKRLKPVGKGLEVDRPLQRVESDEWQLDLLSIMSIARFDAEFGPEFLETLGLDNSRARWWLVVAIDVRTRVILGMKLTRNPKASAAIECLRMATRDKGQWADAVGALSPWPYGGAMEEIFTDNGAGFKATSFTEACNDLGITLVRTIAGQPSMRGTVERFFQAASNKLMARLKGRTFASVMERAAHPSERRACLDAEDVAFALVRWVVDIYHNMPHEGLGGRTPRAAMGSRHAWRQLPAARSSRHAVAAPRVR